MATDEAQADPGRASSAPGTGPDAAGSCRRFNLGDAMILTAVVAVGLVLGRDLLLNFPRLVGQRLALTRHDLANGQPVWWSIAFRWEPVALEVVGLALMAVCLATPTLVVLRLRRPRPPWRRLVRQPGAVACATAIVSFLVAYDLHSLLDPYPALFVVGPAVATAWLVLIVSRRWRAERGWIDRAGRVVGAAWIATVPWVVASVVR